MWFTATPPALVNQPPAKRLGPLPSSCATRARTLLPIPLPSADQLVPFHFARLLAATPPALENLPPAYSAGPLPSSNTAKASTDVGPPDVTPVPSLDQKEPSHLAMRLAWTAPACVNVPPA